MTLEAAPLPREHGYPPAARLRAHQVPRVPGIRPVVASQRRTRVDAMAAARSLHGVCGAERLVCVDLAGMLRHAVRKGGTPYPSVDSHWSPEGHQLIARHLEKQLESRMALGRAGPSP